MEQGLSQLILLGALIAVFYFVLIRPQKKRVEQHQKLVGSVDVGDEVITIGGLYGTVTAIGDEDFELEPSPGTRLRFVKSAIARRVTEDLSTEDEAAGAGTTEDEGAGGAEA
ncbi:MAG: preprotein translocase subunit YajC [Actinomycetota bacterium]|nr:preprotein translocase subunit YajC [Actinomycetota bacterium]